MEIKRDRQVVEEGYGFLDEKRMLVAQELLRRMDAYAERWREHMTSYQDAVAMLAAALGRHGLQGVQVYPPLALQDAEFGADERSFLGVRLLHDATLDLREAGGEEARQLPSLPSPEAEECARRFRTLLEEAGELAAEVCNLLRLADEYQRTERRARALENVILPETRGAESAMEARLEEVDQEEAVRVRLFAGD
jgi:V/A-type H+-transporting ATPase subunit D